MPLRSGGYSKVQLTDAEHESTSRFVEPHLNIERQMISMEIETASETPLRNKRFGCRGCCVRCLIGTLLLTVTTAAYLGGFLPRLNLITRIECFPFEESDRMYVWDLELTRNAHVLHPSALESLHGSHFGFAWDQEYSLTPKWRPQGITTLTVSQEIGSTQTAKFVLVSWYGRINEWYFNRGATIAFVRIDGSHTYNDTLPYTQVMLVDEKFDPFPFLHAGGLTVVDNALYIPDSRYPWGYAIRIFDLSSLFRVPNCRSNQFFDFDYVLQQTNILPAPIKPSFLSFDGHDLLTGTFVHCPGCRIRDDNQLALVEQRNFEISSFVKCRSPVFDMQGAAMTKDILLISTSWGSARSHLHLITNLDSFSNCNATVLQTSRILSYPAGLEDLHIDQTKNDATVWMLTEFSPRIVFVTSIEKLFRPNVP